MTRQDVIDYLEFLQEQEHAKADSILPTCNEMALGIAIEALKQPEIVRCKDCKNAQRMCQPWNDLVCEKNGIVNRPDFYCADGEKRSD